MQNTFTLHCITWQARAPMLMEIRTTAHAMGLLSLEEAKANKTDKRSHHALVLSDSGTPLGCARITPDGRAERMAILSLENRGEIESALKLAASLIPKLEPGSKRNHSAKR